MPRTHIVQSWVGACEFDEGDTYSGEQIGNRNQKSIGVLIERSGDQWKAGNVSQDIPTFINGRPNIQAFAEPVAKPKAAKKTSAFDSIMLADRNYSRLCGLSEQLDTELDQGLIDLESWAAARRNIDLRIEKAWQRVLKERPELIDNEELQTCRLDTKAHTEHSRSLRIDYSVLSSDSVFNSLKDDNFFKQCACFVLTSYKWFAKLTSTAKQLVQEGLV